MYPHEENLPFRRQWENRQAVIAVAGGGSCVVARCVGKRHPCAGRRVGSLSRVAGDVSDTGEVDSQPRAPGPSWGGPLGYHVSRLGTGGHGECVRTPYAVAERSRFLHV